MEALNLYHISIKYVRNLSHISDRVFSVSPQTGKNDRPFLGIITLVNGKQYCIPLTSPKEKHKRMKSDIDLIKIFDVSGRDENNQFLLIGILNLNNMIPVNESVITPVDLTLLEADSSDVTKYKIFMNKQLSWCRKNVDMIQRRADRVYRLVTETPDKNRRLTLRSLPFIKLEGALEKYTQKKDE